MPLLRGDRGTIGTCWRFSVAGVSGTVSRASSGVVGRPIVSRTERWEVATMLVV